MLPFSFFTLRVREETVFPHRALEIQLFAAVKLQQMKSQDETFSSSAETLSLFLLSWNSEAVIHEAFMVTRGSKSELF